MQSRFRRPLNFSASVTHAHCILGSSRKLTSIETKYMQILKFQVGIISLDSQDPRIFEMLEKMSRRRPCHWTTYQELCQHIIRAVRSLLCWILLKNVEIANPKQRLSLNCRPMKYYRNYLINCGDLLNNVGKLTKVYGYLWQKKHPGQNLLLLTPEREGGREGGKLHPHSCIPEARCDNGQIENSNTWDILLQLL